MSFYQKILITIVFGIINGIHFLERKFYDVLKLVSLSSLNIGIIALFILNLGFFSYLFQGIYYNNNYFYLGLNTNIYTNPVSETDFLGFSISNPFLSRELPLPEISSKVALVADKKTDKVLYEVNSSQTLASASTTKLMTALVSIDLYKLDQTLVVSKECTEVEGSKVGLIIDKEYSVIDLLNALLVQSGADAACVLASGNKSYPEFVYLMNKKALDLDMNDTSFTNPIGLDGVNGTHYSTAFDLYTLAKVSMSNKVIADIVVTKELTIKSIDGLSSITLVNTNRLLWDIPNTVGVKTGTTAAAGEVLIYEYFEKAKNIDLVIIVMNSSDRFSDTQSLLSWTLSSYSWDVVTD